MTRPIMDLTVVPAQLDDALRILSDTVANAHEYAKLLVPPDHSMYQETQTEMADLRVAHCYIRALALWVRANADHAKPSNR